VKGDILPGFRETGIPRMLKVHDPVNGRVIHMDPTFEHEFFDMARAQGVGDVPADAHENDLLRKMRPLEAYRHRCSPLSSLCVTGREHTPERLK
jgi:hypothetical protein